MISVILNGSLLQSSFWAIGTAILAYFICTAVYNLYFHPLCKIPGPKRATVSLLYEFIYDVLLDGQYLHKIDQMHDKYGPVVRINPREVHIRDSNFYGDIYFGGGKKAEKDPNTVRAFWSHTSMVSTIDHSHHRARRGYMNPYFSKRAILEMEPMIHERIDRLFQRLDQSMEENRVVCLNAAFSALTADLITEYVYGESYDNLGSEDFKFPLFTAFYGLSAMFHLTRFLPIVQAILKKLPISAIRLVSSASADFVATLTDIETKTIKSFADGSLKNSKSIIVSAFGDAEIPKEERSLKRLLDEGIVLILAGTETSARALSVGVYHLLNNDALLQKLREELRRLPSVANQAYTLAQLESLPYLAAVVHEALRISPPINRLPRVIPHETLRYRDLAIPPGTPISQSTWFVHKDPTIFPHPLEFDPERWIKAAEDGFPLTKYLSAFSKGSRQCIGINMATAEIYLTLARVALTYDMELHNTTQDDLVVHHARILGYPKIIKGGKSNLGEIEVKLKRRIYC